jgi:regulatory protein
VEDVRASALSLLHPPHSEATMTRSGPDSPPPAGATAPPDPFAAAVELAFRFIAKRDRTVAEVRAKLQGKGVEEAAVDHAVAELTATGYLDDGRYAQRFAEDRINLDGWGSDRIERRLVELGVEREHITAALRGRDFGTELDAAVALLQRRWREPPASDRERERALGFLVRKGYDLEIAYDALRQHR